MTILGVDVSEYQGVMNWPKCKAFGAEFAYFRVGRGPDEIDDQFPVNRDAAPAVLPTGGYWVFDPDWSGSGQADAFCDLLATWHWKLRPWIDVELLGSVTTAIRTNRLEDFVYGLIKQLRVLPVIYTRAEWFNTNLYRKNLWSCCDLAVARYCSLEHPWGDGFCKPKDWDDWTFWQWSADGNGWGPDYGAQSDDIDLVRFSGVLPGSGMPPVLVKRPAWLRSAALATASQVASTWAGRPFEVVEESVDWVKVAAWIKRTDLK